MKLELYNEVYKWLVSLNVINPDSRIHIIKNNGKIEIDEQTTLQFYNGHKVGELIHTIELSYTNLPKDQTLSLKDMNTPTARLFNWNVLSERLRRLNVDLDADLKQLILGGDLEMIGEVLKDLYQNEKQRAINQIENNKSLNENRNPEQWQMNKNSSQLLQNIEQLNSAKPLNQAEFLIEFIILSLSQSLNIKAKQAQQLLSNGNKLLTHLCLRGVKGSYGSLVQWMQEIYNNSGKLISLCTQEENNIHLLLNVIKPALFAKDEEVVQWCLRVYIKIAQELLVEDKLFYVYQWTIEENGGLSAFVVCLQKQPNLSELISQVFLIISRFNASDFFTIQLKKVLDSPKLTVEVIAALLPYLTQAHKIKDGFIESGVIQIWIEWALKLAEPDISNSRDHRIAGLVFLVIVWCIYPQFFDPNLNQQAQILNLLQKATNDASNILRYFSIIQIFKLLDSLAKQKSSQATLVYKKIITILIENYSDFQLRSMIYKELQFTLNQYPSIPIDILIDPLVRQMMSNQYINLPDIEFYQVLTRHPNIKMSSAINLLEAFIRIYTVNIVFGPTIFPSIQQLLQKFVEKPDFQEYIQKFVNFILNLYKVSIKNQKSNVKLQQMQYTENQDAIIASQRRALIIELLKFIINLKSYSVNELIKPILINNLMQLKQIEKQDNRALFYLLSLLGNPLNLIEESQDKYQSLDSQNISNKDFPSKSELFLDRRLNNLQQDRSTPQNLFSSKLHGSQERDFLLKLQQKDEDEALAQQLLGESVQRSFNERSYQYENLITQKLSPIKGQEWQCQYEEGELKYFDVPHPEIILMNFDEEEDLERESINLIIHNYENALQYLFRKYTISEKQKSKIRLLQDLSVDQYFIKAADIFKMIKDYGLQDYSKFEEVIHLIQEINIKFPTNRNLIISPLPQLSSTSQSPINLDQSKVNNGVQLDYSQFTKFIVQYAMMIFSKPPFDFRKLPAGQILLEFFRLCSKTARIKNENSLIFDDPEGVTMTADKQTIQKWNMELSLNPSLKLPETLNLKKVQEPEVVLNYNIKKNLFTGVKDSFIFCYEIVNEIIQNKFKTSIIEPHCQIKMVYHVKPMNGKFIHKHQQLDPLIIKEETLRTSLLALPRVLTQTEDRNSSKYLNNKSLEITMSSDLHSTVVGSIQSSKIINKYKQMKILEEREQLLKQELKNEKWRKHKEELDRQQEKLKDFKFDKKIEKFKKVEEDLARNSSKIRTSFEKLDNKKLQNSEVLQKQSNEDFMVSQRELLGVYKSQVFDSIKQKELEDKLKHELILKKEKQEQEAQFKNRNRKVIKTIHTQSQIILKSKQSEVEKEKKLNEERKKNLLKIPEEREKLKQLKAQKKEFKKKLKDLYLDQATQSVFKAFQPSGKKLFQYFVSKSDGQERLNNQLNLLAWLQLNKYFKIHPDIFSEDQVKQVFFKQLKAKNEVIRVECEQQQSTYDPAIGLDYYDFEQALFYLAFLGQAYFNKISGTKDTSVQKSSLIEYKKQQLEKEKQQKEQDINPNQQLNTLSQQTLEGLIGYLDVPSKFELFDAKINFLNPNEFKLTTAKVVEKKELSQILQDQGLQEKPQREKQKKWQKPGTHNKHKEEEIEEKEKEEEKNQKKFDYIKRNQKIEQLKKRVEEIRGGD